MSTINPRMVAPQSPANTRMVANEAPVANTRMVAQGSPTIARGEPVAPRFDSSFEIPRAAQDQARGGRELAKLGEKLLGKDGFEKLEKAAPELFKALGLPLSASQARGGVPAPGATPVLTQHGGAVLDKPVVSNIYLGSYWNTQAGAADRTHNDAFTKEIGTSGFQNIAKEYGAGGPTFGGSTVVNTKAPSRVTEQDVQTLVKAQLAAGNVKPNAQGIYNVVLPPNTVLDAGDGTTSLNGLGGFHGSVDDGKGNPIYYSVIAYSKGRNGIDFTGNAQDNVSITESHEWMETVTDPDVNSTLPGRNLGWYDDKDNGEIGDLAISQLPLNQAWTKDAGGFAQQLEWSNKDKLYEIDSKPGRVAPQQQAAQQDAKV